MRAIYLGCAASDPEKDLSNSDWLPENAAMSLEEYNEKVRKLLRKSLSENITDNDISVLMSRQRLFPNSDIIFGTMFKNKENLKRLVNAFVPGILEGAELEEPIPQYTLSGGTLECNAIRVDIAARFKREADDKTEVKADLTVDMQRTYDKEFIENRTAYYACRFLESQSFETHKYKQLKPVYVTFICVSQKLESEIKNVGLYYKNKNGEYLRYGNLLNIYEIDLRNDNNLFFDDNPLSDRSIYQQFFTCRSRNDLMEFAELTDKSNLAYSLLNEYVKIMSDDCLNFWSYYGEGFYMMSMEEMNTNMEQMSMNMEQMSMNMEQMSMSMEQMNMDMEQMNMDMEQMNMDMEQMSKTIEIMEREKKSMTAALAEKDKNMAAALDEKDKIWSAALAEQGKKTSDMFIGMYNSFKSMNPEATEEELIKKIAEFCDCSHTSVIEMLRGYKGRLKK